MAIKVKLLPKMSVTQSASHAAKICYTSKIPELYGTLLDVLKSLFKPSHHTTLQHAAGYETFEFEGIAVGDVTQGLHLTHPFYNTDQRSGRYAGKMYSNPDFHAMMQYVRKHWPELEEENCVQIRNYLEYCVTAYKSCMPTATSLARTLIKNDRPYVKEKDLDTLSPKNAQDQMRMFIPVLFPTAMVFTVNLTALVAMYEEAWNPGMRVVVDEMVHLYTKKHPDTAKFFDEKQRRTESYSIPIANVVTGPTLAHDPRVEWVEVSRPELYVKPHSKAMAPVDKLHFIPELMDNNIGAITSKVVVPLEAYGQDQRHRTIRRGGPQFTGEFYLPPLMQESEEAKVYAVHIMQTWLRFAACLPSELCALLAPYGAMVEYVKSGSFNAKLHEQGKRNCKQAGHCIANLSMQEGALVKDVLGEDSPVLSMYQPPCLETGKCIEGDRYCGRDMQYNTPEKYFVRRLV